jgi:hypothetical protein
MSEQGGSHEGEADTQEWEARRKPEGIYERTEYELVGKTGIPLKLDFKHEVELRLGRDDRPADTYLVKGSRCPQPRRGVHGFAKKLRDFKPLLDDCLDRILTNLRREKKVMGLHIAMDGTDLPAYAVGQKTLWKDGPERTHFSDPDAGPGYRSSTSSRSGGFFYGFKSFTWRSAQTRASLLVGAWPTPDRSSRPTRLRFSMRCASAAFGPGRARRTAPTTTVPSTKLSRNATADR